MSHEWIATKQYECLCGSWPLFNRWLVGKDKKMKYSSKPHSSHDFDWFLTALWTPIGCGGGSSTR